jgi:hypothetical protein
VQDIPIPEPGAGELTLPIFDTVINGKTVIGSIVGTRNDLADVFALHAAGRTKVIAVDRKIERGQPVHRGRPRGQCPGPCRLPVLIATSVGERPLWHGRAGPANGRWYPGPAPNAAPGTAAGGYLLASASVQQERCHRIGEAVRILPEKQMAQLREGHEPSVRDPVREQPSVARVDHGIRVAMQD